MKKLLAAFFGLVIAIVVTMAVLLSYANHRFSAPGPLAQASIVLIERGKGVASIAQTLEKENVIASAFMFKAMMLLERDKRPLQAGEYEFLPGITMHNAAEMLREGRIYRRKITIPEGMTSWQVVESLRALTDIDGDITETPVDGALLPDTYNYIRTDSRAQVLDRMRAAMEKATADLWPARAENLPFTTEAEAITLASIVEKETGVASERARIAGVFVNRLRRGMPLQSDPTVIYAMTKGQIQTDGQGPIGRRLLTKDMDVDSPYNTYKYPGLPPAPIANPGRAAIEAVLHPETHDFIYFVADGTGGHVFARTLDEHNRNVANWRKVRRQSGQ